MQNIQNMKYNKINICKLLFSVVRFFFFEVFGYPKCIFEFLLSFVLPDLSKIIFNAFIGFGVFLYIWRYLKSICRHFLTNDPEVRTIFVRTVFLWFFEICFGFWVLNGPPHPRRQCRSSLPGGKIWKKITFTDFYDFYEKFEKVVVNLY